MLFDRNVPRELLGSRLPAHLQGFRLQLLNGADVIRAVDRFLTAQAAAGALSLTWETGGEGPPKASAERDGQTVDGRDAPLIQAAIEARYLARSDPAEVASLLGRALAGSGVHEYDPTGERFDPARHRAVLNEPADPANGQHDGIVAETLRIGYVDADNRIVSLPHVSVYSQERA